jgi:acyl-CoA dehydrogenase
MAALSILLLFFLGAWVLAFIKAPFWIWTVAIGVGLTILTLGGYLAPGLLQFVWILGLVVALLNIPLVRQQLFMAPLLALYRRHLPTMSATEREALEAGTVWWEAELFSGHPHWERLRDLPSPRLSEKEQAFLDGPVEALCQMLNDWEITYKWRDLPPKIWEFIKSKGFLGMIIPEQYGGLGFSAQAHSAVIAKISSRSGSAAVTVMVPNSLGPAELLLHYGTETQKNYYLPRLADGRELPCFALTGPFAGSDASSIPDRGVVCHGEYAGKQVLGIRVTWEKRYITLAPVATVLGLAFQLYDPEHLLGDQEYIGITLALIPTNHPGVEIGRRHYPARQAFQNGPTTGQNVFIPMDMVIGGHEQLGQGWRMLMERLAVGRSISLPALASATVKLCARTTGAYARVRKQFKVPIGKFEGVEEALARIAGAAYAVEAARRVTACALDQGHEPAVISALLKYQSTERQRQAVNDAMDVHGGRTICEGPRNYLSNSYVAVPVSITVEGANILTRSLIVFGQGAIRCHPWLLKEIEAAQTADRKQGLSLFDTALCGHIAHLVNNLGQALLHNLTLGRFVPIPAGNPLNRWYQQLGRASVSFALVADAALLLLGGELKRREKLSGRFADLLGEMYFMSCVLKRFEDEGRPAQDLPLVEWVCHNALYTIQYQLAGILYNFPSKPTAWLLRRVVFPLGLNQRPASDQLGHAVASILLEPSEVRDRLTNGIFISRDPMDITGRLEHALEIIPKAEAIEKRLAAAVRDGKLSLPRGPQAVAEAVSRDILTAEEVKLLETAEQAIRTVIDVDSFAPEELAPHP